MAAAVRLREGLEQVALNPKSWRAAARTRSGRSPDPPYFLKKQGFGDVSPQAGIGAAAPK